MYLKASQKGHSHDVVIEHCVEKDLKSISTRFYVVQDTFVLNDGHFKLFIIYMIESMVAVPEKITEYCISYGAIFKYIFFYVNTLVLDSIIRKNSEIQNFITHCSFLSEVCFMIKKTIKKFNLNNINGNIDNILAFYIALKIKLMNIIYPGDD